MIRGYYNAATDRYGDYFWRVAYTNLWMDWNAGPEEWSRRAYDAGWAFRPTLDMGPLENRTREAIREKIIRLRPYWNRVVGIELADEPDWPKLKVTQLAMKVRDVIDAQHLPPRPLGITYDSNRILTKEGWDGDIDWIGLEAYLTYVAGESLLGAQERMRKHIRRLLRHVGERRQILLVGQAYDRNGTWLDESTLVGIQEPIFRAAEALGGRLLGLAWFSYARKGGTGPATIGCYPSLRREHRRLLGL